MDEDIIIFIVLVVVIFIPILAVTARFTLIPILEALVRLRESMSAGGEAQSVSQRLERIENRLDEIGIAVDRLADAERFDRQLERASRASLPSERPPGEPGG